MRYFIVIHAVFLLTCAGALSGETLAFSADINGQQRSAAIETMNVHGVPYLSLSKLVRELGGGMREDQGRILLDMLGQSARIAVHDTRVESSLNSFMTNHPFDILNGEVLLSTRDVEPFFKQAFDLTLRKSVTEATAAPVLEADPNALAAPPIATAPPEAASAPEDDAKALEAPPIATPPAAEAAPPAAESAPPAVETAPEYDAKALDTPAAPEDNDAQALAAPPIAAPAPGETPAAQDAQNDAVAPKWSGKVESIVIDAGHGGADTGYTGASGLVEKDFTLSVAKMLQEILKATSNIRVAMTRESDAAMTASERMQLANREKADLFLSLHGGASLSARAHGIAVLYPASADRDAAAALAGALAGAIAAAASADTLCVRPAELRVFEGMKIPAVLIEPGCLTNPAEETLLATEAYQRRIAEGIAKALAPVAPEPESAPEPKKTEPEKKAAPKKK